MRNLVPIAKWSVCLAASAIAIAACTSGPPQNDVMADANNISADETTTEAVNAAEANQAAPADGNTAAPGSEAAGNAAAQTADSAPYRASGSEPFWSLTLGSQMVYDSADGPDITVATPKSRPTRSGPEYVTPEMTVHINQFRRCTQPSGEEVHDTVTVTIGTQKVSGCGEGKPPR